MVGEVLVRSSQTQGGGLIEGHDDCGVIPPATSLTAAKLTVGYYCRIPGRRMSKNLHSKAANMAESSTMTATAPQNAALISPLVLVSISTQASGSGHSDMEVPHP